VNRSSGLSSITVPWDTLLLSVVLYIVVPVIVAQFWRHMLLEKGGQGALARTLRKLAPLSLLALLLTLVLLFGLQGEQIIRQPLVNYMLLGTWKRNRVRGDSRGPGWWNRLDRHGAFRGSRSVR
jgi:hypothetical protein